MKWVEMRLTIVMDTLQQLDGQTTNSLSQTLSPYLSFLFLIFC